MQSSRDNNTPGQGKGQESSPEAHPRDGHLRIPNKVAEAFAQLRMSGSQAQILWAVLRKTLGWQRSGEWKNEPYPISLADLNQATSVSRRWLLREIEDLTRRHILTRQQRRGKAPLLSLNLDVASWGVAKPALVAKPARGGGEIATSLVAKSPLVPASNQIGLKKPKETYIKKTEGPTTTEVKILDTLRELKGWRHNETDDLAWLRDFRQEFPDFVLAELRAARDYYSGRAPPKHKGIWKNRFRNWMRNKAEFKRREKPGPRGKSFAQYMREQEEGS